jgi:NAD(P)-dependent dehydrogenase (short-subunit alcohol dehydrogenase family)
VYEIFSMILLTSIFVSVLAALTYHFTRTEVMPSLAAIRAANAAFVHSSSPPPVAVFVGGTSGIGEGAALTFAEHTKGNSNIVIVGRNRAAAEKILASMPAPPSGSDKVAREFVQCDATLMKNVQAATQDILSRYPKINYLVMSPGMMTLSGRDETTEGIDKKLAVHYYARWKFVNDLLPAVKEAKHAGEQGVVMSVMAAGKGGAIDLNDLALKNTYSLSNAALVVPTYNDLMMEASQFQPFFSSSFYSTGSIVVRTAGSQSHFYPCPPRNCADFSPDLFAVSSVARSVVYSSPPRPTIVCFWCRVWPVYVERGV